MNTNIQPQILEVQPQKFPKELKKIWLSIIGENFEPEHGITLIVDKNRYPIPKSRVRYIHPSLIQVSVFLSENERDFDIEVKQNPSQPQTEPNHKRTSN